MGKMIGRFSSDSTWNQRSGCGQQRNFKNLHFFCRYLSAGGDSFL